MKKFLSVLLAFIMIFSTAIVGFAEEARFNMHTVSGSTNICRGEKTEVYAVYDDEMLGDVELVWSIEGDACEIQPVKDKETGLITGVKVKGIKEGESVVKVDMVSENGEIIDSADETVKVISFRERIEYEKASAGVNFLFVIFLALNFIIMPFTFVVDLIKY